MNTKQRFINELNVPLHVLLNDDPKFIDTLEAMLQSGEAPDMRAIEYVSSVAATCFHEVMAMTDAHKKTMASTVISEEPLRALVDACDKYMENIKANIALLDHYEKAIAILSLLMEGNVYRLITLKREIIAHHSEMHYSMTATETTSLATIQKPTIH